MALPLSLPLVSGDLLATLAGINSAAQDAIAAAGWQALGASDLDLSGLPLADGIYTNANAQALVSAATWNGHRTLTIGFRGSNDDQDWLQDFQNINAHFDLFGTLASAVNAAAARGEFDLVLVTGHSLGGAMAQMFMAAYNGIAPAYAVTTGSPGFLQDGPVADARIINYQVSNDPIIVLADHRAEVGQFLNGLSSGTLGLLAGALAGAIGFDASIITSSVPFLTQNYYHRGTNVTLPLTDRPASAPSLSELFTSLDSAAHRLATYINGTSLVSANPFDLRAGATGGSGNDALFGTTANDVISGGAGADAYYLHVARADASLTTGPGGLSAISSAASGSDTLFGIERLVFTDKKLAFDIDGAAGASAKLIGAIFGSGSITPEFVGIGLSLFDSGMSDAQVAQIALGTPLLQNLAGGTSNDAVVRQLYQNVVGSAPPQAELDYFTGLIDSGVHTLASLAVFAAETDLNQTKIGLAGLAASGIEFL